LEKSGVVLSDNYASKAGNYKKSEKQFKDEGGKI